MIHSSYFIISIRSLNIALLCLPKAFGRAYSSTWCRKELFFSTSGWFSGLQCGGNKEFVFLAVSYLSCWSPVVLWWQDLWKIYKKYTIVTIIPQLPVSRLSDTRARRSMDAGALGYALADFMSSGATPEAPAVAPALRQSVQNILHLLWTCRSRSKTCWSGCACQEAEEVAEYGMQESYLSLVTQIWESCWYW